MSSFTIDEYRNLLQSFIDANYKFCFFDDGFFEKKVVYLRHEIDFSFKYALPIAEIENELNIQSTFFIQMDSALYNPFEIENKRRIDAIYEMGHSVCLHIDETKITDYVTFSKYLAAFKEIFPYVNENVISRHRPDLDHPVAWMTENIIDVYSNFYFNEIEYASDSRGEWRYGHPLERDFLKANRSIQLLTHPFWWIGSNNLKEKVANWLLEEERDRIQSNKFIEKFM